MEKKIELHISETEAGHTIQQILKQKVGLTPREIRRIKFRKNGILRNGIPARCTEQVEVDDELVFLLEAADTDVIHSGCSSEANKVVPEPNKWIPWPGPLEVLYEDEDILIVNKPSGMPSHPSPGHYSDTLANRVAWYLMEHGQSPDIHMAGRLDKDTSGVMVFAKSRPAAARLAKQRTDGRLKKEYLAWVWGSPEPKTGMIDAPIGHKEGELNRMEVRPDGKNAVTHYRVIREENGCSLIHVTLEQGRTHQIRVHMSWAGHPLLGDPIYGDGRKKEEETLGFHRAALHAWRLTLESPFTGELVKVEVGNELFPLK